MIVQKLDVRTHLMGEGELEEALDWEEYPERIPRSPVGLGGVLGGGLPEEPVLPPPATAANCALELGELEGGGEGVFVGVER